MILDKSKFDFIIILIGKLLQVAVMIASIKVVTTILEPKDMGYIYIFTTVYTFFVLSFISPFGLYINRKTHKWHEEKTLLDKIGIYLIYLFAVSIFSIFIGYFLYNFGISNNIPKDLFLSLLFIFVFFMSLNQTILPLLNMLHYRLSFIVLMVLTSLGSVIFGYLLVTLFGSSAKNWLIGMIASNIIFMIVGYAILTRKIQETFLGFSYNFKKITKVKIKSILTFVVPLSVATIFMWVQNSGYRILIEQNISLEFLGFIGVGMAVSSQIALTVESVVTQYLYPIFYKNITNATLEIRTQAINYLINKVIPIYLMLAIFLTCLSQYVVEILVDEKYYEVYIFTTFGIWVEFFRMVTNLLGNVSQSEMNTKGFMAAYILGSLITICLVYFSSISNNYKLYLPMALIIGGMVTMTAMYFYMKKIIKFKINFKLIFLSFAISIPYGSIYFLNMDRSIFINLSIVALFGLYFLGTIFLIYKKV